MELDNDTSFVFEEKKDNVFQFFQFFRSFLCLSWSCKLSMEDQVHFLQQLRKFACAHWLKALSFVLASQVFFSKDGSKLYSVGSEKHNNFVVVLCMKTGSVLQTIKPPTGFGRFCLDVSGTKCIIGKPLDLEEHSNPSTLQRTFSATYFLWLSEKAALSGCFNIILEFFPLRFELEDLFTVCSVVS